MKIWIDDVRPAPEGYVWCQSVNNAKNVLEKRADCYHVVFYNGSTFTSVNGEANLEKLRQFDPDLKIVSHTDPIEVIDIDHDAGDFVSDGGDYIKLLDWLEETGRNYPIHIHSMNPVGVANMRAIIQRNGWREV